MKDNYFNHCMNFVNVAYPMISLPCKVVSHGSSIIHEACRVENLRRHITVYCIRSIHLVCNFFRSLCRSSQRGKHVLLQRWMKTSRRCRCRTSSQPAGCVLLRCLWLAP